ncbi:hypothetical protein HYFRA_00005403 [Hymenoscyphus fraxineus]|uniref:Short-chain dehydrogenase n=1 Tax=Hymenoscyphus fraxineus TaxID=746836 RepID=A0A9N9Q222_9HELO|nr:hypothetical protein HYFRA_00005403 [Hymenoscyphus fraxineus]
MGAYEFWSSFLHSQLFEHPKLPDTTCAGQTIIVTGANTGLGKEAARHFAALGARKLILAVRNIEAGEEAKRDIEATTQCESDVIEVWELDLCRYESIDEFVKQASQLNRVDVLLSNAGMASLQWNTFSARWDMKSRERIIGINVISTFYLAISMIPKLKTTASECGTTPRLTMVVSDAHLIAKFTELKEMMIFETFDDKERATPAVMMDRYPTSKLLEVLIVRQIAPMLEGSDVVMNMVNPGFCKSDLAREKHIFMTILSYLFARTTETGAAIMVTAAMSRNESIGKYFSDGRMNDEALSKWVRSMDGKQAGIRVWNELKAILEDIQRGVTSSVCPAYVDWKKTK